MKRILSVAALAAILALPLFAMTGGSGNPALAQGQATALFIKPTLKPEGLFPGADDPVLTALYSLSWTTGARPDSLVGRPGRAAKMLALQEYLSDYVIGYIGPDFDGLDAEAMAETRRVYRAQIGLRAELTSAQAVAYLWELSKALDAGDQARASAVLNSGIFTRGEADIRATLAAFPIPVEQQRAIMRADDSYQSQNVNDDGYCPDC